MNVEIAKRLRKTIDRIAGSEGLNKGDSERVREIGDIIIGCGVLNFRTFHSSFEILESIRCDHPLIVADLLYAWNTVYSEQAGELIKFIGNLSPGVNATFASDASLKFGWKIEGLVIGLLEIANSSDLEVIKSALSLILRDDFATAMNSSSQTPAGSGRLSELLKDLALKSLKDGDLEGVILSFVDRLAYGEEKRVTKHHNTLLKDNTVKIGVLRNKAINSLGKSLLNELTSKILLSAPLSCKVSAVLQAQISRCG